MMRFAPFEARPEVAVGVSGGADSLCLIHCADAWARTLGGRAVALIVDHGLRPESADEAEHVAGWMAAAGIAHQLLSARAAGLDLARGNIQASARAGRSALMEGWCRRAGVLHLLLAHHRDDPAETLLQRLARGSGAHGLAAMTPERSLRHLRVLRPLLDQPKARLVATLAARGLGWIEDPSNRDPRFDRVRLREALTAIAGDDILLTERLAHTAGAMRRTRRLLDAGIDGLLARAVTLSPLGYAMIDARALDGADRDLAARALGLVIATVGAAPHPPRREAMLRWLRLIARADGGGATLAGAQLARWRDRWLVHREPAAVAPPITLQPGKSARWDDRFECELDSAASGPVSIGALGRPDPVPGRDTLDLDAVPRPAQSTLPAARLLDGTCRVPHLSAGRNVSSAVYLALNVFFSPRRPLTDPVSPGERFQVVARGPNSSRHLRLAAVPVTGPATGNAKGMTNGA